jgi:uncharacterized DUF497 family protein
MYDVDHSDDEDRFRAIGPISSGIIVVVYTERENRRRLISARFAYPNERKLFLDHIAKEAP